MILGTHRARAPLLLPACGSGMLCDMLCGTTLVRYNPSSVLRALSACSPAHRCSPTPLATTHHALLHVPATSCAPPVDSWCCNSRGCHANDLPVAYVAVAFLVTVLMPLTMDVVGCCCRDRRRTGRNTMSSKAKINPERMRGYTTQLQLCFSGDGYAPSFRCVIATEWCGRHACGRSGMRKTGT